MSGSGHDAESAARLAKLEGDLAYRVREVETLNGDVAQLTEALRTRGLEVEALNGKVAELASALGARGAEVEALHARLAEARGALEARDAEVRALDRKVRELSLSLEARGREIDALAGAPAPEPPLQRLPAAPAGPATQGVWPARPPGQLPGLAWTLVRTDFKIRYHGTLAGFLWALLKPLAMFGVLVGVFSWAFAAQPDYAFQLVIGLFVWDFFAEGTRVGMLSLLAKGHLLAKTRFPRSLVVLTSSANSLLTLSVFAAGVVLALFATGRGPGPLAVLLLAAYLAQLFLIVLGTSLASSVLFLRYRDLNQIWEVLLGAGFFLAPIVYPLGIVPERFHFYLYLWPPTPVMQYARSVLVGGTVPSLQAHLLLLAVTLGVLSLGVLAFRRLSPRAAEYL